MRVATVAIVVVGLWAAVAPGAIRCGDDPGDDGDLLIVRLLIDVGCDCNGLRSTYIACARQRITATIAGGNLRPECERDARRCATRSVCGRPGRVTCCRTVRGEPRCKIRKSAAACTASGGTVGVCPSCCGACTNECFGATSTTTTTTTLPQGTCGDSVPTCGGSCPAGEVCARDDDIELAQFACRCFPAGAQPCMQAGFPACGGACLDGEACQAISVGGDVTLSGCFCVSPTSTCGPFPGVCQGFGRCAAGQICSSFVAGGSAECGCVTSTSAPTTTTTLPGTACGDGAFPQCDGACPTGLSCQAFQTASTGGGGTAFCTCVVTGSTCETPAGGGCAIGQCPAGETCTAFVVGETIIDCGCGP